MLFARRHSSVRRYLTRVNLVFQYAYMIAHIIAFCDGLFHFYERRRLLTAGACDHDNHVARFKRGIFRNGKSSAAERHAVVYVGLTRKVFRQKVLRLYVARVQILF